MISPSMSCLCLQEEESLDHFFLQCSFVAKGQQPIFNVFGVDYYFPKNINDWLMEVLNGRVFGGKGKVLWRCDMPSFLQSLWKERNSQVLKSKYSS